MILPLLSLQKSSSSPTQLYLELGVQTQTSFPAFLYTRLYWINLNKLDLTKPHCSHGQSMCNLAPNNYYGHYGELITAVIGELASK